MLNKDRMVVYYLTLTKQIEFKLYYEEMNLSASRKKLYKKPKN